MATDTAKHIRNALKAAGFGARDISVRARNYTTSSSVDVEIKRADISLAAVERIAEQFQHVRRDGSGEILGGGNTFVGVKYADGALVEIAATVREQLAAGRTTFGSLDLSDDEKDPDCFHAWENVTGRHVSQFSREYGAQAFARLLATRGETACLAAAEPDPVVEGDVYQAVRDMAAAALKGDAYPCSAVLLAAVDSETLTAGQCERIAAGLGLAWTAKDGLG